MWNRGIKWIKSDESIHCERKKCGIFVLTTYMYARKIPLNAHSDVSSVACFEPLYPYFMYARCEARLSLRCLTMDGLSISSQMLAIIFDIQI